MSGIPTQRIDTDTRRIQNERELCTTQKETCIYGMDDDNNDDDDDDRMEMRGFLLQLYVVSYLYFIVYKSSADEDRRK